MSAVARPGCCLFQRFLFVTVDSPAPTPPARSSLCCVSFGPGQHRTQGNASGIPIVAMRLRHNRLYASRCLPIVRAAKATRM